MITGVHAIDYPKNADAIRTFFRDDLDYRSVGAGRGWPNFALPPAEIAMHPFEAATRTDCTRGAMLSTPRSRSWR
jgi:hypothetical protein